MKDKLQLILKTITDQYDTTAPEGHFDGKSHKDIFLSGVATALIIVNGLDFMDVKETKP